MHDQMVNKLSVKEYGDPFSNATKRKRENKRQENKAVKKVKKRIPLRDSERQER